MEFLCLRWKRYVFCIKVTQAVCCTGWIAEILSNLASQENLQTQTCYKLRTEFSDTEFVSCLSASLNAKE